jgi:predicted nucleic acid-binding protein
MFLLDTNIVSEWTKPRPSPRLAAWLDAQVETDLFLSVITFAELRRGSALLAPGRKREALTNWIDGALTTRFEGRVLDVDRAVCDVWGELLAHARKQGHGLGVMDGFVAATALANGLTLVTRNVSDLTSLDLSLLNPFDAP